MACGPDRRLLQVNSMVAASTGIASQSLPGIAMLRRLVWTAIGADR